jgi:hypothetical protein
VTARREEATDDCRICRQPSVLQNSHVIPEWGYRRLYDDKHRMIALRSGGRQPASADYMQKGIRERLLCKRCETRLSRYEKYARHSSRYRSNRVDGSVSSTGNTPTSAEAAMPETTKAPFSSHPGRVCKGLVSSSGGQSVLALVPQLMLEVGRNRAPMFVTQAARPAIGVNASQPIRSLVGERERALILIVLRVPQSCARGVK